MAGAATFAALSSKSSSPCSRRHDFLGDDVWAARVARLGSPAYGTHQAPDQVDGKNDRRQEDEEENGSKTDELVARATGADDVARGGLQEDREFG